MTAVATDVRVITQQCDDCFGYGYLDDGTSCGGCNGRGRRVVHLVRCPVHSDVVGIDPEDGLLGQCSGCAGEAARGIQFITTTGLDGSSQQRSAIEASKEAL